MHVIDTWVNLQEDDSSTAHGDSCWEVWYSAL